MSERTYIVTYDIVDQRRWRGVFKLLSGYGEWLQLSVFQCRLSRKRRVELFSSLSDLVESGEDHVLIIDLGPADRAHTAIQSLGKKLSLIRREATVL